MKRSDSFKSDHAEDINLIFCLSKSNFLLRLVLCFQKTFDAGVVTPHPAQLNQVQVSKA